MLRGINRSIIEINDTGNRYFERVLIFVKPEFGNFPEGYLQKEAAKMVGAFGTKPVGLKNKKYVSMRRKAKLKRNAFLMLSIGALAVVGIILALII